MKEVRFTATDEEYAEILAYVEGKRRWRKMAHFARYAIFKEMDANKAGRHDKRLGAAHAERSGGKE
jgi:muconolactone delta-isomerase